MKRTRTTIRRILCFLLCLAMLPLVKVSAAGYSDAYNALIKWAKQGEYETGEDPDIGKYKAWGHELDINNNEGFAIVYEDAVDPGKQDRVILAYVRAYSENSVCVTEMLLTPASDKSAMVVMISGSDREDGSKDSHGLYAGVMKGTLRTDRTLEDGLDITYFDAPVSQSRIRSDCKRELKKVLEYTDKILRENSKLTTGDIFSKISPWNLHNPETNWVEKEETCTQDGAMAFRCGDCGVVIYSTIKGGHIWEFTEAYTPATETHGSGLYTCSRCGETIVDDICISSAFEDVPPKDNWAHAGIDWAVYHQITNGTSIRAFSPNLGCTRGQVVTFLWRTAGCPEPENTDTDFIDVKPGAFYEKAVAWAVENGITLGTSETMFSPDNKCNRGQIVTFLWRFMGEPSAENAQTSFKDLKAGGFYLDAVAWAVENNITNGMSTDKFAPDDTCTRAQVVTFLHRTQKPAANPVDIGISLPTQHLQRWQQDGSLMKNLLEKAGYDVELAFARNNGQTQARQIEKMVRDGAKVIIVAVNSDGQDNAIAEARKAGVKIIAYDQTYHLTEAVDYYAGFDSRMIGEMQGRFIEEKLDLANAGEETYNIEFITGDASDRNAEDLFNGGMSVLKKYLDSGILVCRSGQTDLQSVSTEEYSSEKAQERFESLLAEYYADQPLHAVLSAHDLTSEGVAAALENESNYSIVPVLTGRYCDIVAVRNIAAGKQSMSVFEDARDLAEMTVGMADTILKGNEPETQGSHFIGSNEVPACLCTPKVCTSENIRELLIDSGYYTSNEIYGTMDFYEDGR